MSTTVPPAARDGVGLEIASAVEDGRLVVHVRGELDVATRPMLCRTLEWAQLEADGVVFVDVAELAFIDAAGLGALVDVRGSLRERSRDLVVLRPNPVVARILAITGLTDLLASSAGGAADAWPATA